MLFLFILHACPIYPKYALFLLFIECDSQHNTISFNTSFINISQKFWKEGKRRRNKMTLSLFSPPKMQPSKLQQSN